MQINDRQYCWSPERGDCFRLPMGYPVLARAYGPADVAHQLAAAGNPAHHPRNARHHGRENRIHDGSGHPMWRAGVSALVTEAAEDWTLANLQPYRQHIHHEFGAGRIMWGSGWPGVRHGD